jgi:RND family efflux transporter MFP subunit
LVISRFGNIVQGSFPVSSTRRALLRIEAVGMTIAGGFAVLREAAARRRRMHRAQAKPAAVAMGLGAMLLSGCGQGNQYVAPPPPKVTVAMPTKQPVTRYREATGNLAAVNSADLVARVPGFVQKINYEDGARVTKGTLLFTIEPEPYRVKLEQAKAAEAGATATLKQAQASFQRQADLLARQTASQATYDQALATRDSSQSSMEQATSSTQLAQINYDYTQVTAPFDGTVTARQVSVGQYVGGTATPTVLATIVQHDPIYANFNVSERDVLEVRASLAALGIQAGERKDIPISIGLQTEDGYPHRGTLDYAAPTVDSSTGTLAARAVFHNADKVLLPGYFVRVRIPLGPPAEGFLIPDVALGSDQGGRYVLTVNKDNVVEQRKVELGPLVGTMRVIDNGLTSEDRVIVGGLLRAIPGQKVDPEMKSASSAR